jgi:4-alpha-glucanotransferase
LQRRKVGIHTQLQTHGASPLLERAASYGIETEYRDGLGRLRKVGAELVRRLLSDIAVEDREQGILPRSVVLRGTQRWVPLARPVEAPVRWEVLSDHTVATGMGEASGFRLPAELPNGLLRLRIDLDGSRQEAKVIVCSERAYQGPQQARMWGIGIQLYAIRSARNWGHGDFTDLMGLLDLAAELGASAVGLNPLHALFDDRPAEPSPYFPSSRLFLNPLYIDPEAVPEFPGARQLGFHERVARLQRRTEMVDYAGVVKAKAAALRSAYQYFRAQGAAERRDRFEEFRRGRGATLAKFACFEFLRRKFRKPWWEWPPPWRRPDVAALDDLRRREQIELGFFEFVQWLAHEQLECCRERGRQHGLPIGLYLDVAVGVRRDGFDAWCEQDAIVPGMTIGAPPDLLNRGGQDWGLAAFNPPTLERTAFETYRLLLQASMRYAGAIRLDHVLGLKRLFLVPAGQSPADGVYIREPFESLLAVTALLSNETKCIVIGEDLGTVPKGFRDTMLDWGLWSYQVMLFERTRNGNFRSPPSYRRNALATFATHDLPTFAGWLQGQDLTIRRKLGLASGETRLQRQAARVALARLLRVSPRAQIDFATVARFLANTPARLVMISLEDLLELRDQINIPGTTDQYPNWIRRLPVRLNDIAGRPLVARVTEAMRAGGRSFLGSG